MTPAHRRLLALPATVLLAATACSSSDDGARVAVPTPSARAAKVCRALHSALPDVVDGQHRRTAEPESAYTALWGEPAIRLRCGVARPDVLTYGNEHYNPDADAIEVNDVEWLLEQRSDGYRFTTTLRTAFVEVTVPDAYAPEVNSLTDLAASVRKTIPVGVV